MIDLSQTTEAKSDQLNADDLISGPRILKVTDVIKTGSADQPVSIKYEGDNGKPYKPNKSMRRILIAAWGNNGEDYIGRSMQVFYEPSVKWAGKEVGGIRISHLSHLESPVVIPMTVTRGKKVPVTIKKLDVQESPAVAKKPADIADQRDACIAALEEDGITIGPAELSKIMEAESREDLKAIYKELKESQEDVS